MKVIADRSTPRGRSAATVGRVRSLASNQLLCIYAVTSPASNAASGTANSSNPFITSSNLLSSRLSHSHALILRIDVRQRRYGLRLDWCGKGGRADIAQSRRSFRRDEFGLDRQLILCHLQRYPPSYQPGARDSCNQEDEPCLAISSRIPQPPTSNTTRPIGTLPTTRQYPLLLPDERSYLHAQNSKLPLPFPILTSFPLTQTGISGKTRNQHTAPFTARIFRRIAFWAAVSCSAERRALWRSRRP